MIRKETWVVLGLFAAALAGLFFWQRGQDATGADTTETGEQEYLFNIGDGRVQAARLERVGQQVIVLERDPSGMWQVAWPAQTRGDSEALESALSQLSMVTILGRMDDPPSMQDMGLEPPAYRLLLTLEDGRQLTAEVGRLTPTANAFYVLNSDRSVSLVNNYSLEPILDLLEELPLAPPEETLEPYPAVEMPTQVITTDTP